MSGLVFFSILVAIVAGAAALSALLCVTLGKSIARQTKIVAALVCGFIPPISIVVLGVIVVQAVGWPRSQSAAMLTGMLCFWALPICLLTSGAMIVWIAERSEDEDAG